MSNRAKKRATSESKSTPVFRRFDSIGDPSAELDGNYLLSCFVDTGATDIILDTEDPRSIVLGRTGAGKTALLRHISHDRNRLKQLDPHEIALQHISNSPVLRFFESAGLNVDPFYRLLWRHLFTVETLRLRFDISDGEQGVSIWDELVSLLRGRTAELDAFRYLRDHGGDFLEVAERRMQDVTDKMESSLKGSVNIKILDLVNLGAEGARTMSQENRYEVVQRGQQIMDSIQMSKLTKVLRALNEKLIIDPNRPHYLLLDRLDENWIDDPTRYRLLRTLIETTRDFNSKVRHAKVVLALRNDLLDRVLAATFDSGFQAEKYTSSCLSLQWSRRDLVDMVDYRVTALFRDRYTKRPIHYYDVLPATVGGTKEEGIDYLINRSLMRPRDIIAFFNLCIRNLDSQAQVASSIIVDSEAQYSDERASSLVTEWVAFYPLIRQYIALLKGYPQAFALSEINDDDVDELCLRSEETIQLRKGRDCCVLADYLDGQSNSTDAKRAICLVLYRIGAIGIKPDAFHKVMWSYSDHAEMPASDVGINSRIHIHGMLHRSLGTKKVG